MGSSSSRFPQPEPYDVDRSQMLSKWHYSGGSTGRHGKKGKYDDYIVHKYPDYPVSYHPQVQPGFPAYYASVPMAVMPPYVAQQPVLTMPQGYFPMVAYQTTQDPVVPGVTVRPITNMAMPTFAAVPAPAPAAQMPAPAPAPVITQPTPGTSQMPEPHPVSGTPWPDQPRATPAPTRMPHPHPSASTPTVQMPQLHPRSAPMQSGDEQHRMPQPHPSSAFTQMPQPHPGHDQGPVIPVPSSPILANPVIPPHPMMGSEPRHSASLSSRPRFTEFYRTTDFPSPHRANADADEPVRPPTVGPAGRTPFAAPASMPSPTPTPTLRMPTPGSTIPVSNNPLPPLPADIWNTLPYRQVLESLPIDVSTLLDLGQRSEVILDPDDPIPRPSSRLGALFGSNSRRDKGKGPLRGLFRSRSTAGQDVLRDILVDAGPSGSRHGHGRAQTMTAIVIPPPGPGTSTVEMPVPTSGPPIKFDHTGDYSGFVNHSNHRVMYKNKMYPTALHLLEAMKFTHQPALQERIRTCKDVNDMYPLSASFQEHVRPDWGQVFLNTMDDVLFLKFKQHPSLRSLLLGTGLASIIYADDNEYWGEGPTGGGSNELGRALVRIRERLRQESD